jgi:hypothetical protein
MNYPTQGFGDKSSCFEVFGDVILLDTRVAFTQLIIVTPMWIVRV